MRRWSAVVYGAFFALFALPFTTLHAACTHDRVDTVNGYQTPAPHDYSYEAANGATRVITVGSDGFAWVAIALVALAIVLGLCAVRPAWLSLVSVAAVAVLFLAVTAAGGARASSKAEIGYWLSSVAVALAPAADVRPWRRAALTAIATIAAAAVVVGAIIGLILLTAQASR